MVTILFTKYFSNVKLLTIGACVYSKPPKTATFSPSESWHCLCSHWRCIVHEQLKHLITMFCVSMHDWLSSELHRLQIRRKCRTRVYLIGAHHWWVSYTESPVTNRALQLKEVRVTTGLTESSSCLDSRFSFSSVQLVIVSFYNQEFTINGTITLDVFCLLPVAARCNIVTITKQTDDSLNWPAIGTLITPIASFKWDLTWETKRFPIQSGLCKQMSAL